MNPLKAVNFQKLYLFLLISILALFLIRTEVLAQEPVIEELIPGFDYAKFYVENNDFGFVVQGRVNNNGTPVDYDGSSFGAYVIEPVGDKLYIGFSTGDPGNYDGALLAVYENSTLTPLGLCMDEACTQVKRGLTEEGLHDLTFVNGTLYIAGTDPCCPDDDFMGNVYTYIPGQNIIKHRNLPNVYHTLGLWVDPADNTIYAVTGAHYGDRTKVGRVFKSTDGANTWQTPMDVSDYRVYDIIDFDNALYAVTMDRTMSTACYRSANNGTTWEKVEPSENSIVDHISDKARLTKFQNKHLVTGEYWRNNLLVITEGQNTITALPPVPFGLLRIWHPLANVNDTYLYRLDSFGGLNRSNNLTIWEQMLPYDSSTVGIFYWPRKNKLILTTKGTSATIKLIDFERLQPLPTPTPPPKHDYTFFGPRGTPSNDWDSAKKLLDKFNSAGHQVLRLFYLSNGILLFYEHGKPYSDYPLKAGEGYILEYIENLASDFDAILNYTDLESIVYNITTNANSNVNFISIPQKILANNQLIKDAASICREINNTGENISKVTSWSDQGQAFIDYYCTDNPASVNFPIKSGKGYLLYGNQAFTWELSASISPTPTPTPACTLGTQGDINCDRKIDILDLVSILSNFGRLGSGISGDVNGDNKVDILDLVTLLSNFGRNG